jgi:OmpA-OmpF porin, OOP family
MKRTISTLLGAALLSTAVCALSASPASAQQPTTGPYISFGAGASWLRDAKTSGGGVNLHHEYETGWGGLGAVGYGLGNGIRLEGELAYRHNGVDKADTGAASGSANAWTFMGNGLYDFTLGWPVTPYVGAGVGLARVNYKNETIPGSTATVNDSDTTFAYQGIAGLAYAINDNLKLDLSYHYLTAVNPRVSTSSGTSVDSQYRDHAVFLALRWEFGAPKPAPMPAAAPAPVPPPQPAPPPQAAPAPQIQRSYLVFFDFDKSNITPEADRVIQQAAANAKQGNVSRIQATGHADRAGPDKYNMALSIRRANAVKAALVRQGIPEGQIVVIGKGETEPLVPTPDGVREPQNRRVEILLQ